MFWPFRFCHDARSRADRSKSRKSRRDRQLKADLEFEWRVTELEQRLLLAADLEQVPGVAAGTAADPLRLMTGAVVTGQFNDDTGPSGVPDGTIDDRDFVDIAQANFDRGEITIRFGNGDGTFEPPKNISLLTESELSDNSVSASMIGPAAIAAGDFNGDDFLDLATANAGSGDIRLLLGRIDGTFESPTSIPVAGGVPRETALVTGDFDGDGLTDLATIGSDIDSVAFRTPLVTVEPSGSLIYEGNLKGVVGTGGDIDQFTIGIDAGQTITLVVDSAASLQPTVELLLLDNEAIDPQAISLGTATATGSGETVVLQTIRAEEAGTYAISIVGAAGSSGSYDVRLLLNAAVEDESIFGVTNDSSDAPQSIDASFISLGVGSAQRGAVLGTLQPKHSENFEEGALDGPWTTSASQPEGRIEVSDSQGAASGVFALLMDRTPSGILNLNEAIWTVDLSGVENATLRFSHADFADEENALPDDFTGSFHGDGVAISDNGTDWHTVLNATDVPAGTWQSVEIDLASAATSAGMTLGAGFQIKFQQFDDFALTTDGRGYDQITITTPRPTEDWFQFTLADGQSATLALASPSDDGVQLELYDSIKTLLAQSQSAGELSAVIQDLVDTTQDGVPERYLVRVVGAPREAVDYSLVVTRDATFGLESNDSLETAQGISIGETVLGFVGFGSPGGSVTLEAINRGWFHSNGIHDNFNKNTFTGNGDGEFESEVIRSFFVFDLSTVGEGVGAVTLNLELEGYFGPDPFEVVDVFDVSASASDLNTSFPSGSPISLSIYNDLGTGNLYGNAEIAAGDIGSIISFPLNLQATADIQNSLGGTFAVGLSLQEPFTSASGPQAVRFSVDAENRVHQLELEFEIAGKAYYGFEVAEGDTFSIQTVVPGSGPMEFVNDLDIEIELFDPDGNPVGRDSGGTIVHTSALSGRYTVRVGSENGTQGEYVLSVSGQTGEPAGFVVTSADLPDNAVLTMAPTALTVDFSHGVRLNTLSKDDFRINRVSDPVESFTAKSFSVVDGNTIVFDLPDLVAGVYTLEMATGALTDIRGRPLSGLFSRTVRIDVDAFRDIVAPTVISTNVPIDSQFDAGDLTLEFKFSEPLREDLLDSSDVELVGQLSGAQTPTSFDYDVANSQLTVAYAALTDDKYTFRLFSGDGQFEDLAGNDLDGNKDGIAGEPYVVQFTTDLDTAAFPTPLVTVQPPGSLIHEGNFSGVIGREGDVDRFTIDVDAGQTITVVVNPDTALQPSVELLGSQGSLGMAKAARTGETAILQTFPSDEAGTYTVSIFGVSGTLGSYNVRLLLNAALEEEPIGGATNDNSDSPRSIDDSFISLGVGSAERGAVLGTTRPWFSQELTRFDNFYFQGLDGDDKAAGAVKFGFTDLPLPGGDGALRVTAVGDFNESGKYLTVRVWDSTGQNLLWTQPFFADAQSDDSGDDLGFEGSALLSLHELKTLMMDQSITFDVAVSSSVANPGLNGVTLELLYPVIEDYQFTLTAGQTATLALTSLSGDHVQLELYDNNRTLLAVSHPAGDRALPVGDQALPGVSIRSAISPTNGHTYHLIAATDGVSGLSWTDAELTAIALGGDLVTINDATENSWVTSTFSEAFYIWTGLNDVEIEGQFAWASGEPTTYTNWFSGEPNDAEGGEDYVHIYNFSSGFQQWNDNKNVESIGGFPVYGLVEIPDNSSRVASQQLIEDFVGTAHDEGDSQYFVRVVSDSQEVVNYSLVVMRDASIEVDSGRGQDLTLSGAVLGSLVSGAATITRTIFSQDFEAGLGASESILGNFSINDSNFELNHLAMNNGSMVLGHASGGYSNDEYSYYQLELDLTGVSNARLEFDYGAQIEQLWDGFNVLAGVGPLSVAGNLLTPLAGMTYFDATVSGTFRPIEIGQVAYDANGVLLDNGRAVFDLSAFAGEAVTVRLQFASDDVIDDLGINIDNLVVVATRVPDFSDTYRFQVETGDSLEIETYFPAAGPGEFANELNVRYGLRDPDGVLVAFATRGLLHHEAEKTGIYSLLVQVEDDTAGEYVLSVNGQTGKPAPFVVTSADLLDSAVLTAAPSQLTLDFSHGVRLDTLTGDFLLIDGVPVENSTDISFTVIDGNTVAFDLPELTDGEHTVGIVAGVLPDVRGQPLEEFRRTFTIDSIAPTVIATNIPVDGRFEVVGDLRLEFEFSETLQANLLDSFDVELVGQLTGTQTPRSFDYNPLNSTLTVGYTALADDRYTFLLFSGDEQFEDVAGNDLDGDDDGIAGEPFVVQFQASATPLVAVEPTGSLIYEGNLAGDIGTAGADDRFAIDVDAGQTITVVVEPHATLQPTVQLLTSQGTLLGTATATQPGGAAILQTLVVKAAGTYEVAVTGAAATVGSYTARVLLNTAVEEESLDGPNNNTFASAQDIDSSFLGLGFGTAERGAVLGSLLSSNSMPISVESDDFESGTLGSQWTTFSSESAGRIQVTDSFGAAAGSFALLMDTATSSTPTLNEAIWTVDLSAVANPTLHFSHADFADEETALPMNFVGSFDGDGVAISDDGLNWHTVTNATNIASGTWESVAIDLAAEAAAAGMMLGTNFQVKFQQFDDSPLSFDGRGYDNIWIDVPEFSSSDDWYQFDLADGQSAAMVLTAANSGSLILELYAADGTTLLRSGAAGNRPQLINNFVDDADNGERTSYFVRVGGADAQYSLVVTRDAMFGLEFTNDLLSAQDISLSGIVLGALGGNDDNPAQLITEETEPNDDGVPGGSITDLPLANDWSGSFLPIGGDNYQAVIQGTISSDFDADWDFFKILASPGDSLVLDLRGASSGVGTLGDPFLRLYDNTGTQIASNDDFSNLDSRIVFSDFGYIGDYYVVADSFSGTGSYQLTATLTTSNLLSAGPGGPGVSTRTIFSQDFEAGLGANESLFGNFTINDSNFELNQFAMNNGSMVLGHASGGYSNDEYSYYQLQVDLTGLNDARLEFDYGAQIEQGFDGFNVLAAVGPLSELLDGLITPIAGMTYVDSFSRPVSIGPVAYDANGVPLDNGQAIFDLTAFAGEVVTVRLQFASDEIFADLGINIDNLVVTTTQASDVSDTYSISVTAGDNLQIETRTPGGGPLEFSNALDPRIELFDPSGALVTSDDNSAADGRNSLLAHMAEETGYYTVMVRGDNDSQGEYVLAVNGHTGADLSPLEVTTSDSLGSDQPAVESISAMQYHEKTANSSHRTLLESIRSVRQQPFANSSVELLSVAKTAAENFIRGQSDTPAAPVMKVALSAAAAAEAGRRDLILLLGNGDGTFHQLRAPAGDANPVALVTGDFDIDGITDLATANYADNSVSILLGNGDGTFQTSGSIGVGDGPLAIVSGDFNHDTVTDLATANYKANSVSILLGGNVETGQANGTFGEAVHFNVGTGPLGLVAGQFNDDDTTGRIDDLDHLDLATVNHVSSDVSVLHGDGTGAFNLEQTVTISPPSPPGGALNGLVSARFNRDALVDLAAISTPSAVADDLISLPGIEDGEFLPPSNSPPTNRPLLPADIILSSTEIEITEDHSTSVFLIVKDDTPPEQLLFSIEFGADGNSDLLTAKQVDVSWLSTTTDEVTSAIIETVWQVDITPAKHQSGQISIIIGVEDGSTTNSGRLFVFDATARRIRELDLQIGDELNRFATPVQPAGGRDLGLATTSHTLLVSDMISSDIFELDMATGTVLRTIPNPGISVRGMAFLNNEVFLLEDARHITVLDYATGAIRRILNTDRQVSEGLATTNESLLGTVLGSNALVSIDPISGETTDLGGRVVVANGEGIGVIGDELYIADGSTVNVFEISALANAQRTLRPSGQANLVAVGGDEGRGWSIGSRQTATFELTVDPEADTPVLKVEQTAAGREDSQIPLEIGAQLADIDGSETLMIEISQIPDDARLFTGPADQASEIRVTNHRAVVSQEELESLRIVVPQTLMLNAHETVTLMVTATATEIEASGNSATATTHEMIELKIDNEPPGATGKIEGLLGTVSDQVRLSARDTIAFENDVDLFMFEVGAPVNSNASTVVSVDLFQSSSTTQLLVRIFDRDGVAIATSKGALDSSVRFVAAEGVDEYFVGISHFNNDGYDPEVEGSSLGNLTVPLAAGDYEFEIRTTTSADNVNNLPDTAPFVATMGVAANVEVNGAIMDAEVDYYKILVTEPIILQINAEGPESTPQIELLGSQGQILASNDPDESTRSGRLLAIIPDAIIPEAGFYWVKVSAGNSDGNYQLALTAMSSENDVSHKLADAPSIRFLKDQPLSFMSVIELDDADLFRIDLAVQDVVRIDVDGDVLFKIWTDCEQVCQELEGQVIRVDHEAVVYVGVWGPGYDYSPGNDNGPILADGNPIPDGPATYTVTLRDASRIQVGLQPVDLAVADLNGDGIPDLVSANYGDDNVSIALGNKNALTGNGDGTFSVVREVSVGDGPVAVVLGDFDQDGITDLATANYLSGDVTILLGRDDGTGHGDGTFDEPVYVDVGDGPAALVMGDFNGNDSIDLAIANYLSDDVTVLFGSGDGRFRSLDFAQPPIAVGDGPMAIIAGYFNDDFADDHSKEDFLDLAVLNRNSGTVSVLLGTGSGRFPLIVPIDLGTQPDSLVVGNLDNNNLLDLATLSGGLNSLTVAPRQVGYYESGKARDVGNTGFTALQLVNIDQDELLDLFQVSSADLSQFSVRLSIAPGVFSPDVILSPTFSQVSRAIGDPPEFTARPPIVFADLDNDGRLDLIFAETASNTLRPLQGDGTGQFERFGEPPPTFTPASFTPPQLEFPELIFVAAQANITPATAVDQSATADTTPDAGGGAAGATGDISIAEITLAEPVLKFEVNVEAVGSLSVDVQEVSLARVEDPAPPADANSLPEATPPPPASTDLKAGATASASRPQAAAGDLQRGAGNEVDAGQQASPKTDPALVAVFAALAALVGLPLLVRLLKPSWLRWRHRENP